MYRNNDIPPLKYVVLAIAVAVTLIISAMFAFPIYRVWSAEKAGEAELAQAEQNRQIAVKEAQAKKDSAKMLAEAEVVRAEGVAKANHIIGDSLKGNEAYIHWLWVDTLKDTKDQIIYIPTEAGVPIMESQRLKEK